MNTTVTYKRRILWPLVIMGALLILCVGALVLCSEYPDTHAVPHTLPREGPESGVLSELLNHDKLAGRNGTPPNPTGAMHDIASPAPIAKNGLIVTVLDQDGHRQQGILVEVTILASRSDRIRYLHGRTQHTGEIRFSPLDAYTAMVVVDGRIREIVHLTSNRDDTLTVVLNNAVDILCQVVDHLDRPVPKASVWRAPGLSDSAAVERCCTDAEGLVDLESAAVGDVLFATCDGFYPSDLRRIADDLHSLAGPFILVLGPGESSSCELTVLLPSGEPSAHTSLTAGVPSGNSSRTVLGLTDESGRYKLDGLAAGLCHFEALSDLGVGTLDVVVRDRDHLARTLQLVEPAGLRGLVLDGSGVPISGARVRVVYNDSSRIIEPVTSSNDGSFELSGLLPGDVVVGAFLEGHGEGRHDAVLHSGATAELNIRLVHDVVCDGTVTDSFGGALEGVRVSLAADCSKDLWLSSTVTNQSGEFELYNVGVRTACIQVRADEALGSPVVYGQVVDLPAVGIGISLSPEALPSAVVTMELVTQDDRSHGGGVAILQGVQQLQRKRMAVLATEREMVVGPVPAGRYTLRLLLCNVVERSFVVDLRPNENLDLGRVVLEPAGSLRLVVTYVSDAGESSECRIVLARLDSSGHRQESVVRNRVLTIGNLAAGAYSLELHDGQKFVCRRQVYVHPRKVDTIVLCE